MGTRLEGPLVEDNLCILLVPGQNGHPVLEREREKRKDKQRKGKIKKGGREEGRKE